MTRCRTNPLATVALALAAAGWLVGCGDVEPLGRPAPLLVAAGPTRLAEFRVTAEGEELLWAIEAAEPQPVEELFYGLVPEGFRQTVPANGQAPRPFDPGEALQTLTRSERRLFYHQGFASGFDRFAIVDSRMELLDRGAGD